MILRRAITQSSPYLRSVAALHSSFALRAASQSHTTESYSKDVDTSPPPDSKIHRVDPGSESAQKPYEPPTGQWSKAGVKTKEYESVSTTEPYKAPEINKPEEGPACASKGGRKPEGR